ncbi:replication protein a 70 kda dna-binding subunit [Stylonychia lemnae]|uniref:Replication protein a 70 kDa dna-binding subunit n=1 Tax=Stylonychia lemnae TaxID=5949 RepID=A0A078AL80_STYLE|nr:replication protein a 70 kda dna-binding subunit [Stylonychia lemnae]|eukprot:CDW83120.1 replication protein a 70 kda dna-binding subunit [Stylonychia lemnae]
MSAITSLTPNGIHKCYEQPEKYINDELVFQVIDAKYFKPEEKKNQIKSKLKISDGHYYIQVMQTDKSHDNMVIHIFIQPLNDSNKSSLSILCLKFQGNAQLKITSKGQSNQLSENLTYCRIFVMKGPATIIYTGLKRVIGTPTEYTKSYQENSKGSGIDIKIPINETDQKFNDDLNTGNSVRNSNINIQENFNRMGIQSPIGNHRQDNSSTNNQRMMPQSVIGQTRFSNEEQPENQGKRMSSMMEMYTPVRCLNNFSTDWKIRARVTKKGDKKVWRNNKGEGVLMNCDLIDKEGCQIQCTFFGEAAEKFDKILKENHVFLFSNGQVKLANKKYTSITNDHCLTFDQNAEIVEVDDDSQIKQQGFSFIALKEIEQKMQNQAIDAIGVIVETGPTNSIPLKQGGNKERKNVLIADESGMKIQCSLWGSLCNLYSYDVGSILGIKNSRVSDYGGKSLNCGDDHSTLYINPRHKRTDQLMNWYTKLGSSANLQNLSGAASGEGGNRDNYRLMREALEQLKTDNAFINGQVQSVYFKTSGHIPRILYDDSRMMYFVGCPECKKKCQPDGAQYKCENCNKYYNQNEVRLTYTITARFDDLSDGTFVSFLSESAETVMGQTALEFSKIRDNQSYSLDYIRDMLNERSFQSVSLVVKATIDNYNNNSEELKFKFNAARCSPIDLKDENQMLLRRLKMYENKQSMF